MKKIERIKRAGIKERYYVARAITLMNCPVLFHYILPPFFFIAREIYFIGWRPYVYLVAGKLAGYIYLCHNTFSDLFIFPEYRSNGIGRSLMEFVETQTGARYTTIKTYCPNKNIPYYERQGYIRRGKRYFFNVLEKKLERGPLK